MASTPSILLLSALLLGAGSALADNFYCCNDPATGHRVCGDTMPRVCRGHGYSVYDRSGNEVKEVGPPLTPEQKAQKALEAKRQKELEEARLEQRRQDQALLDTYATAQDIDFAQRQAESDVQQSINAAQARIDATLVRRRKLANEAEFYKNKAMPAQLASELKAVDHEIKLQQELIELKKRDFAAIKAKYDADRKRYNELTGRGPAPAR